MTVEEVMAEIEPYLPYYRLSGGGITVTGGEPTLQASFVAELFKRVKQKWDLHTALDTSGFCDPAHADKLLSYTDLVLLDLKQMNPEKHIALTSQPNERIHRFARYVSERHMAMWVRFVLVPGWTDDREDVLQLGRFVETLGHVEKIEVLPYHRMGVYKWQQIGRAYTLEGTPEPTERDVARAYSWIAEGRDEIRRVHSSDHDAERADTLS